MVTKYKFDDAETLAIYVIVESKDVKKFLREVLDGNFNRDDYKILPKVS